MIMGDYILVNKVNINDFIWSIIETFYMKDPYFGEFLQEHTNYRDLQSFLENSGFSFNRDNVKICIDVNERNSVNIWVDDLIEFLEKSGYDFHTTWNNN